MDNIEKTQRKYESLNSHNVNDKSVVAKKAEDYIRYATKQDVKHKEIRLDEQGRICVDKHKSTVIDHKALASNFVKLASIVPMSAISRKIIQMKLVNPGISMTGVSLQMGLLAHEINSYEKDGINRISEYIRRTSLQEASEKANADSSVKRAVKNLNVQGKDNSLLK